MRERHFHLPKIEETKIFNIFLADMLGFNLKCLNKSLEIYNMHYL